MRLTTIIITLSVLLLPKLSRGQVEFAVELSSRKVAVGERFTVEFSMNQRGQNFKAPSFQGVQVLGGPNTSVSTYMDPSGTRFNVTYSYILEAKSAGTLTLGPAFITIEGETYQTQPQEVKVVKNKASTASPDTRRKKDEVILRALVSKRQIYVGEPIHARYRLYFRTGIGQPRVEEEPQLDGFYKKDIEKSRIETTKETYQGRSYNAGNIREMVLIPQKSGTLQPGQVRVKIPVREKTGRYDFFGRPETQTKTRKLTAQVPSLEVKPLPRQGKPSQFSGAVGDYSFEVDISRKELSTDESLTITLEIEGQGNIELVNLPEVKFPEAFESFEPERKSFQEVGSYGMRGRKKAEYLLVPRYPGTYKLGPFSFSYFDPQAGKYRNIKTPTQEITVKEGQVARRGSSTAAPPARSSGAGQDVDYLERSPLYIRSSQPNWEYRNRSFVTSPWFALLWYGLLAGSGLLLALMLFDKRRRKATTADHQRQRKASRKARQHLRQARKALHKKEEEVFYHALSEAIWGYFGDKLAIPTSRLTKDFLRQRLEKAQVPKAQIEQTLRALEQSEMARYTQAEGLEPEKDYQQVSDLLTQIERYL